jgi:hypothetical protein
LETEESDMTVDLALEARRLNAIGDPLRIESVSPA